MFRFCTTLHLGGLFYVFEALLARRQICQIHALLLVSVDVTIHIIHRLEIVATHLVAVPAFEAELLVLRDRAGIAVVLMNRESVAIAAGYDVFGFSGKGSAEACQWRHRRFLNAQDQSRCPSLA